MKTLSASIAAIVAVALLAGCDSSDSGVTLPGGGELKRFQVESGRVVLELSGMQSGTETAEWNRWGLYENKTTQAVTKIMGITQKQNSRTVTTPDWIVNIDLDKNAGIRMANPIKQMAENMNEDDAAKMGEKMLEQMGGKKSGTMEILGRTCDVYEVMMVKTCVWKGIELYSESKSGIATIKRVAVSLEEGASVGNSTFDIDPSTTISDGPNLSGLMGKRMPGQ